MQLIVGESVKTRQVLRHIDKVAQGTWPVLVLGETGTGKEMVARSIYQANPRGPFITIDCSSLVGTLMESELFGYAKGAFTGAVAIKRGLIELADGGTAFFDEIGELPLDLQAKLLRVLQEKEFRPVGALASKRSDFRVIAATNRDLAKEVEKGNFRRDLYYRLNVVTVKLAPLRERREDVRPLVEHFLKKYGNTHAVSEDIWYELEHYDWPGNVRELENCVQQMVAMNSGPSLHIGDLPSPVRNHRTASRGMEMAMAMGAGAGFSTAMTVTPVDIPRIPPHRAVGAASPVVPLAELERKAIMGALEFTHGDRAVAAHLLGIGRTTLYRKLKEYQVAV
ncbi:MAG: sigma-54 dependent transcriptional regulator [Bryobacteraceae bacterium]